LEKRFDPASLAKIVIKVGSSSIVGEDGTVRLGFLGKLATTIGRLRQRGVEVVLVSSGAVAMGARRIGEPDRPTRIPDKQACAALGQTALMALYEGLFVTLSLRTAQVLLSRDDLEDRRRYLNAREALLRLLELGAVPIINENDSVAVEEIQFGDNDQLSALVAGLINADLLILLTNVDGVFNGDPRENPDAQVIERIETPIDELIGISSAKPGAFGKGGMRSKLEAARLCRHFGIHCVIARGRGSALTAVLDGEPVGTYIPPAPRPANARQRWLANAAPVAGKVRLDPGAVSAVRTDRSSLLPSGVVAVDGEFSRGAVVILADADGNEVARGVVRYNSVELRTILGRRGSEIEDVLGYTYGDRVIHRDYIALTR